MLSNSKVTDRCAGGFVGSRRHAQLVDRAGSIGRVGQFPALAAYTSSLTRPYLFIVGEAEQQEIFGSRTSTFRSLDFMNFVIFDFSVCEFFDFAKLAGCKSSTS